MDTKEIQVEKKGKLSLAQPEAWVELLMILVCVTLCKISLRRFRLIFKVNKQMKRKKEKKDNDACLEKIKNEPIICVHLLHTRAI